MAHVSSLQQPAFRQKLDQCIHCGLCLQACPTYNVLQLEMDSPRGRIALLRAAADGRLASTTLGAGAFQEHIDLCLGCRACETACPSGVQYGLLLETARAVVAEQQPGATPPRALQWLGLRQLMPYRGRLRALARGLALYQRLGVERLARRLPFLPAPVRTMQGMLPRLRLDYPDMSRPAPALGVRQGRVAFFAGCIQDAFLAGVNAATIRVLQRNGYEVHFPGAQTCCGAASLHTGDPDFARALARRNIDACASAEYDAIVNNAGGCGATLKEYDHLLADDPAYAERARAFVARVMDISEFLAERLHNPPTGEIRARVVFLDSCHLRHGQKIFRQPRALLRCIPGLELVELSQPDQCCGSAGIYNLLQPVMANEILDRKLADLHATGATIVATANTGCHMQMLYGLQRAGLPLQVMHVAELLDLSYAAT
jgi:glycolate oxidase iron-sulfur subunit